MSEQKRGQMFHSQIVDESGFTGRATSLTGDPVDLDGGFAIPGLDPDAVAPDGVDAAADDSGCEGGACKI